MYIIVKSVCCIPKINILSQLHKNLHKKTNNPPPKIVTLIVLTFREVLVDAYGPNNLAFSYALFLTPRDMGYILVYSKEVYILSIICKIFY